MNTYENEQSGKSALPGVITITATYTPLDDDGCVVAEPRTVERLANIQDILHGAPFEHTLRPSRAKYLYEAVNKAVEPLAQELMLNVFGEDAVESTLLNADGSMLTTFVNGKKKGSSPAPGRFFAVVQQDDEKLKAEQALADDTEAYINDLENKNDLLEAELERVKAISRAQVGPVEFRVEHHVSTPESIARELAWKGSTRGPGKTRDGAASRLADGQSEES